MSQHRDRRVTPSLRSAVLSLGLYLAATIVFGSLMGCGDDPDDSPSTSSSNGEEPAKNLVLLLIDTLRADRLNCYGYDQRRTSPRLDEFAVEGALFERVLAPAPWTIASTGTLFTGLQPFRHGFTFPDRAPLSSKAVTAAEIFLEQGFKTGAFSANLLVCEESGFAQGFDDFELLEFEHARTMTDKAIDWLDLNSSLPFFLYVHYFDPHDPYEDPDGLYKGFDPDYEGPCNGDIANAESKVKAGEDSGLSDRDVEHLLARYDAEIKFADGEIGRLLDRIDQLGLTENTVVAIVSDHGEQFLEHRGLKHGTSVHQEELWVPWLLRAPGQVPAGARIEAPVGLSDVLPTCLALAGLDPLEGIDGLALDVPSLAGITAGGRSGNEGADRRGPRFSQTQHGVLKIDGAMKEPLEILTAVTPEWKLIRYPTGEEALHSIKAGFDEDVVRVTDRPDVTKGLSEALLAWKANAQSKKIEQTPYSAEEFAEKSGAMRRKLIAIGYMKGKKEDEEKDEDKEDEDEKEEGN